MTRDFGPVTANLDLWRHQANFAVQLSSPEMPAVTASYGGPERGFLSWPAEAPQRDPHCHLCEGEVTDWLRKSGCGDEEITEFRRWIARTWMSRRHEFETDVMLANRMPPERAACTLGDNYRLRAPGWPQDQFVSVRKGDPAYVYHYKQDIVLDRREVRTRTDVADYLAEISSVWEPWIERGMVH